MNCPHCQQEVPANHKANWCPACGRDFQEAPRQPNQRAGLLGNYLRVTGLLAAPAVVTVAAAKLESLLLAILGVGGCIAAGIYCARLVIWEYEVTGIKAMLLQFGLAFGLSVLSLTISYLGCSLGLGNS